MTARDLDAAAAGEGMVRCTHSLRGRWQPDRRVRCSWCGIVLDEDSR